MERKVFLEENAKFSITPISMESFLSAEMEKGASKNMLRRFKAAIHSLYEFLPEDKCITKDRLDSWRSGMDRQGYAAQTVQNYVKYVNRYLNYCDCSELRFRQGKAKDLSGMQFGFLTALEPTEKRDRKDVVWRCICKCGKEVNIPARRLLLGNTKSCGCLSKEHLHKAKKFFAGTSIEQSVQNPIRRSGNKSGYVGVIPKRDKWQAYITYQKKHYYLGCYTKLEDAVNARARAKEAVVADALELKKLYEELHKNDGALPGKKPKERE